MLRRKKEKEDGDERRALQDTLEFLAYLYSSGTPCRLDRDGPNAIPTSFSELMQWSKVSSSD